MPEVGERAARGSRAITQRDRAEPDDLAIVIVSTNEVGWLDACLSSIYAHAGDVRLDVVVVDNSSSDGTREFVESRYLSARVVTSENLGFAHANNRGALTCDARYVLFLNPDTEIAEGSFAELASWMDAQPAVGLLGVRQLDGEGQLYPTIRYFPTISRALGEALLSERWPIRARWAGERELNMELYDREVASDWTTGAFMLVRREALLGAGLLDERFFLQSEEPDLCRRIKLAGWQVRHVPTMTIVHHAGKAGIVPKMVAQNAFARLQYARKHFSRSYAAGYLAAYSINHIIRAALPSRHSEYSRRAAARLALRTLLLRAAPYKQPPPTSLRP